MKYAVLVVLLMFVVLDDVCAADLRNRLTNERLHKRRSDAPSSEDSCCVERLDKLHKRDPMAAPYPLKRDDSKRIPPLLESVRR